MKYTFPGIIFLISACLLSKSIHAIDKNTAIHKGQQKDTGNAELKEFKAFSSKFFQAAKSDDTVFLKEHVIFPIAKSTVSDRIIDQRYFIGHLPKFFPKDMIKRIDKEGKFVISKPENAKEVFIVTVYDTSRDTEANYSWVFEKRQNKFYFVTFRAEVG